MISKKGLALACALAAGLTVCLTTIESLGVGEYVRYEMTDPEASSAPLPEEVVAPARGGAATTVLAAGDIAECKPVPSLANMVPATSHMLGFATGMDTRDAPANLTAALARDLPDAPILAIGDLAYGRGSASEFDSCFDKVWSGLKPRILPAPGNHEYRTLGAAGYFDYWGRQAGPAGRGYYAARVPGWLLLSLDSETDARPGSPQARWLAEELAGAPGVCILAFYHRPAYSLADRGDRATPRALFRQLQQAGATLVLNGHNHFYERTVPLSADGAAEPETGTVAFTVGTGGRVSDPRPLAPQTAAAIFGRTGLLRLDLRPGGYDWAFLDAVGREALDAGSGSCNSAGGQTIARGEGE